MKVYGWIYTENEWIKVHIKNFDKKSGLTVYDPIGRSLTPNQGPIKRWYFSLKPGQIQYRCDDKNYKKNKGEWHEQWQNCSPKSHLEIYRCKDQTVHIADMVDKFGVVVEFQHSSISAEDVLSRETLYRQEHYSFDTATREWKISTGGMYWVIDATNSEWIKLENNKILIREKYSWWNFLTEPVFFDIGVGIACLDQRYFKTYQSKQEKYQRTTYFLCTYCSYEYFIKERFVLKEDFKFDHLKTLNNIDSSFTYTLGDASLSILENYLSHINPSSFHLLKAYSSIDIANAMAEYSETVRSHNLLVIKIHQMIEEIAVGSIGETESKDLIEQKIVKEQVLIGSYSESWKKIESLSSGNCYEVIVNPTEVIEKFKELKNEHIHVNNSCKIITHEYQTLIRLKDAYYQKEKQLEEERFEKKQLEQQRLEQKQLKHHIIDEPILHERKRHINNLKRPIIQKRDRLIAEVGPEENMMRAIKIATLDQKAVREWVQSNSYLSLSNKEQSENKTLKLYNEEESLLA
jgi:DNA-directed RNA polymerase subunit RPC12/RpoP